MPSITITSITTGDSIDGEYAATVNYTHDTLTDLSLRYRVDGGSWVDFTGEASPSVLVISGLQSDGLAHLFHIDHEGDNVGDTYYATSPTNDITYDRVIDVEVIQGDSPYTFNYKRVTQERDYTFTDLKSGESISNVLAVSNENSLQKVKMSAVLSGYAGVLPDIQVDVTDVHGQIVTKTFEIVNPCVDYTVSLTAEAVYYDGQLKQKIKVVGEFTALTWTAANILEEQDDYIIVNRPEAEYDVEVDAVGDYGCTINKVLTIPAIATDTLSVYEDIRCPNVSDEIFFNISDIAPTFIGTPTVTVQGAGGTLSIVGTQFKYVVSDSTFIDNSATIEGFEADGTKVTLTFVIRHKGFSLGTITPSADNGSTHTASFTLTYRDIGSITITLLDDVINATINGSGTQQFSFLLVDNTGLVNTITVTDDDCERSNTYTAPVNTVASSVEITGLTPSTCTSDLHSVTVDFNYTNIQTDMDIIIRGVTTNVALTGTGSGSVVVSNIVCNGKPVIVQLLGDSGASSDIDSYQSPAGAGGAGGGTAENVNCFNYPVSNLESGNQGTVSLVTESGSDTLIGTLPTGINNIEFWGDLTMDVGVQTGVTITVYAAFTSSNNLKIWFTAVEDITTETATFSSTINVGGTIYIGVKGTC